jgi:hypothetical protein
MPLMQHQDMWNVEVEMPEVYGDKFLEAHINALSNWQDFQNEDLKYHFDAVVLNKFLAIRNLLVSLYYDPGWSLVYYDGFNVIFLKNQAELKEVIERHRIDFQKGFQSPLPEKVGGPWMTRELLNRGCLLLMF